MISPAILSIIGLLFIMTGESRATGPNSFARSCSLITSIARRHAYTSFAVAIDFLSFHEKRSSQFSRPVNFKRTFLIEIQPSSSMLLEMILSSSRHLIPRARALNSIFEL